MYGLGVIVNGLVIVGASFAALILKKFIMKFDKNNKVEKISDTIMSGLALCIIYMGISGALECQHVLICIISMVVGGLIGELIDIDKGLNSLGDKIEEKLNKGKVDVSKEKVSISQGFVSASLLFCVGAMAVVGALNSGLFGNNDTLFAKSALDGVSSFLFSLTMGIGVLLSAVAVFLYEGIIACGAFLLKGVLSTAVIAEMNAVGSLLILALGINMILKANIKVANLLPAMFVPIIFGIIGMI
ncbi:DUF554 domain-containing protein [Intestinibacter bartlettii]|uniref:DUF554 domain-containing protein n=1 Tax=Intestinibacter bartlettii TaxID=261299 RepID=UPI000664A619|nr:DUF554 domain-containing protein [Intestinibacter bartlettii]KMW25058.1 hypothetical protein HMPREF0977_00921 [Clostridium sp. 1_1_41A1FAA]MDU1253686.1 DUF554 domain-containing protein [Peptostreptococcaceae bacterium]MDU5919374.1 DUF554 domain-containing protein [Clostridiales bacterium]MCB5744703.1 DUF554 domain-containing protein [Intestinibacter bartlettii]MDU2693047.1 DUF554 domain-containing protein [Intestinibacter bartlettii]